MLRGPREISAKPPIPRGLDQVQMKLTMVETT
jgi:hypothetical protein